MVLWNEYLIPIAICSPIFFFILAVACRLLDNSASMFLDHEILVDSSYVSADLIREQLDKTHNPKLKKALQKALIFRRLHSAFIALMLISIPITILMCVTLL
ncbi:hypothetical protein ACJRPK_00820 [Aquimarina sp. 2-A2]|uniref:hypothetical protein n=1 Tax=Aquimarina sp. 2-A2 TaxID=3382644 RepID=UPI00387EF4C5